MTLSLLYVMNPVLFLVHEVEHSFQVAVTFLTFSEVTGQKVRRLCIETLSSTWAQGRVLSSVHQLTAISAYNQLHSSQKDPFYHKSEGCIDWGMVEKIFTGLKSLEKWQGDMWRLIDISQDGAGFHRTGRGRSWGSHDSDCSYSSFVGGEPLWKPRALYAPIVQTQPHCVCVCVWPVTSAGYLYLGSATHQHKLKLHLEKQTHGLVKCLKQR